MAKGGPLGNGQVRPLLFVIAYLFPSILDNPAPVLVEQSLLLLGWDERELAEQYLSIVSELLNVSVT